MRQGQKKTERYYTDIDILNNLLQYILIPNISLFILQKYKREF